MLIRLVLIMMLVGGGIFAFRWWRAQQAAAKRRLGAGERRQLTKLGQQMPLLVEALESRDLIHQIAVAQPELLDDVDSALRQLGAQATARKQIATTADRLTRDTSDQRLAELEVEASTTNDPEKRDLYERRLKQAEEQRKTAEDLLDKEASLKSAQEKLVLELKDLQLALVKQSASNASGDEAALVRERLRDASADLGRRAAAMDELSALLGQK